MADLLCLFESIAESEFQCENFAGRYFEVIRRGLIPIRNTYSGFFLTNDNCEVDYSRYEDRWAYIFTYGFMHAKLVKECLKKAMLKESNYGRQYLNTFMQNENIKICSLGGGPGVDSLGVLEYLFTCRNMNQLGIQITTVDWDDGWENTNHAIIRQALKGYLKWKGLPTVRFIQADLLKPLSDDIVDEVKSADIILMVKVISALSHDKNGRRQMIQNVIRVMKEGSIVVYVDNNYEHDVDLVERIATDRMSVRTLLRQIPFTHEAMSDKEFSIIKQVACLREHGMSPINCLKSSALILQKYWPTESHVVNMEGFLDESRNQSLLCDSVLFDDVDASEKKAYISNRESTFCDWKFLLVFVIFCTVGYLLLCTLGK